MKTFWILLLAIILSCKKNNQPNDSTPISKGYELFFAFDSLKQATGYDIQIHPIIFDYNNNGKYDLIICRKTQSRTATTYTYELLNPIVILDDKRIIELPSLWKGGSTFAVADFNGDKLKDIAIMDNGPEYWDLNPNPPKTPLTVYWNSNSGLTGSNTIVKQMTNGCFNINTVDADKDGVFEIIPMGNQFEDFSYEFNGGTFIKTEITNMKNISHTPAIYGDFNKDGNADVFAYGYDVSGNGNISVAKPAIISNINSPNNTAVVNLPTDCFINILLDGDFDKNGFTDFIAIVRLQGPGGIPLNNNHYLFYIENKGNNQYVTHTNKLPEFIVPSFNGYPMAYTSKDIDFDGDPDFYNINSSFNIFYLNNNGVFKEGL